MENQQLRDINEQLKDLLSTYNNETRKMREDYERKDAEFRNREAELKRALVAQEKKMVDKVMESIDYRQQGYNKASDFDVVGKMSKEFDLLRQKREEIAAQLGADTDKLFVPGIVTTQPVEASYVPKPVDKLQAAQQAPGADGGARKPTPGTLSPDAQPRQTATTTNLVKPAMGLPATKADATPKAVPPEPVAPQAPAKAPRLSEKIDDDFMDDFDDI